MPDLYRPTDAAKMIGIADSTLRTWSIRLTEFMSSNAQTRKSDGDTKTGHRRFTTHDIAILARAKELSEDGVQWGEIEDSLRAELPNIGDYEPQINTERSQDAQSQPVAIAPALNALAAAYTSDSADLRRRVEQLERDNVELRERLTWLEALSHEHPGIVPKRRAAFRK